MKKTIPNLVTVIMTAYNSERYVAEAIESVFKQAHKEIEIICVDDGSTDKTGAILRSYGNRIIHIAHPENRGIGTGRNSGLNVARGSFVAFIDADDIWNPGKLDKQLNFLNENPSVGIVFGYMQCFISPDLDEKEQRIRYCPKEPSAALVPSAVVARSTVFDRVGLFDPQWRVGEFVDWFARAKDKNISYKVLPDVVVGRRIHGTNTGITERPDRVDYVRIARAALERKRLAD